MNGECAGDALARRIRQRKLQLACQDRTCHLPGRMGAVRSREIIRALRAAGWQLKRVSGSHHHFTHPNRPGKVTVKHPARDFPTGTLKSIERQAGMRFRTWGHEDR